jgi:Fur family ferric uptake transcriptional regulator
VFFCRIIGLLLIIVAIRSISISCIRQHTQTLRARGYRMTSQRLSIMQALHDGGHLSPGQIYERIHAHGMTETTVYRTLDFLARNGIVHPTQVGGGHLAYELAGHDHHHLVCRVCGTQLDLASDAFNTAVSQIERQTGYQIEAGHLTFFGLCPECKSNSQ